MFKIVIPSANREKSKNFKTIKYLRKIGFDLSRVYLFLDDKQINNYKKNFDLENVNIIGFDNCNVVRARNYIEKEYFNDGEKLLCLDDDIIWVNYKNDEDVIIIKTAEELENNFNKAFDLLEENNCKLFGVYPIGRNEPWFKRARNEIGNNHILACCSGVIVDKSLPKQNEELYCKEEYERAFIYGKNIRLGFMGVHTKYYCNDGIGERSYQLQMETCCKIMDLYPNRYSKTALKINKKKGNVDLRMNKNYYNTKTKIFLISMDNEIGSDRRSKLNYDYIRFNADEPNKHLPFIKDKFIHYWNTSQRVKFGKEGCFDSYYKLFTKIIDEKLNDVIITEDDCFLKEQEFIEFCKNKPKEICYLNGKFIHKKGWETYNDFTKNIGINNIDYEKCRIIGTWGIYFPKWEQVKILIDELNNMKRFRHIDILFSKKQFIKNYYYPSIFFNNDFGKSQIVKPNKKYNNYIQG